MSAVQFIFRGEACWRGGEEFRVGFNLTVWIRVRKDWLLLGSSWPSHLLYMVLISVYYQGFFHCSLGKLFGRRGVHQQPSFTKKPQGALNALYSCELSGINLTLNSASYSVDHKS